MWWYPIVLVKVWPVSYSWQKFVIQYGDIILACHCAFKKEWVQIPHQTVMPGVLTSFWISTCGLHIFPELFYETAIANLDPHSLLHQVRMTWFKLELMKHSLNGSLWNAKLMFSAPGRLFWTWVFQLFSDSGLIWFATKAGDKRWNSNSNVSQQQLLTQYFTRTRLEYM